MRRSERETLNSPLPVRNMIWGNAVLVLFFACIGLTPQVSQAQTNWRQFKKRWPKLWIRNYPCTVYKVVDGDTTHVKCKGRKEKLRLVGIDTPETKHPFKPIEYFGPEASARAKALLPIGSQVWLGFGRRPTRRGLPRGSYGRVLAYLFMPNGRMFNAQMVREGYALALRRYPHVYMQRFVRIESNAKRRRRGMWADPSSVRKMLAGDTAYRQHRKRCKRQLNRRRFNWVIGDRSTKHYVTRYHGHGYFRTNPSTRVLFCSTQDAERQGYREAPKGHRSYRRRSRRGYTRNHFAGGRGGSLIVGDTRSQKFYVFRRGSFRVFKSISEAKAAGFKRKRSRKSRRRGRRARRRGRRAGAGSVTKPNCGGKTPIVGNRRSKRFRLPTMRSYRRATRSKNAVYFCTAQEALQAGYIRAKR